GILFRRGDALQSLANCQIIAFDKTGTLTLGAPTLTHIATCGKADKTSALRLAASVEQHSEHPIARAIVQAAKDRDLAADLTVNDFQAVAGLGVRAQVDSKPLLIGSRRFLQAEGV
ncbi:HAD family hydrolase, partial [Arthrospira platensis SPKY1]|nr:HAD family hydrolase [Arthrospira platensis SPKY1]